jgi:hypothetical protein
MTLAIIPDPNEPAGGFAFVRLPQGLLGEASVYLALQDSYASRWLRPSPGDGGQIGIGNPAWGPEPHAYGPYPVQASDGFDWIRIGPEIVNKIEEYSPVRLRIGNAEFDLTWPDDVLPRAGAALTGGILAAGAAQKPDNSRLVGKVVASPPKPEPVAEEPRVSASSVSEQNAAAAEPVLPEDREELEDSDEEVDDEGGARRSPWLLPSLLAVLLLVMAIAFWLFGPDAEPDADIATPVAPAQQVAPNTDGPCGYAALAATTGDFGAKLGALRACGPQTNIDTALRLLEDAAAGGDGGALMVFGHLYDSAITEDTVETMLRLTFDDAPAQAADYYARAVAAGHTPAQAHLAAICQRLATATDTLSQGAYNDHCL